MLFILHVGDFVFYHSKIRKLHTLLLLSLVPSPPPQLSSLAVRINCVMTLVVVEDWNEATSSFFTSSFFCVIHDIMMHSWMNEYLYCTCMQQHSCETVRAYSQGNTHGCQRMPLLCQLDIYTILAPLSLSIQFLVKHTTGNSQSDSRLASKVMGCGKDGSYPFRRTNKCARTSLTYTHHNIDRVC